MGHYGVLTSNRAKAALPFAANYRIIDFALSSLRCSHVDKIGLIIQYLPASLIEHVGVGAPWDLHLYGRVLRIMPPFVGMNEIAWYKGTADALYQNLNFVHDQQPRDIIVLSGEHVYNFDFASLIAFHRDMDADVTFAVRELPPHRCLRRFGYVSVSDEHKVTSFAEKPDCVESSTISTGIYVFKRHLLVQMLEANASEPEHNLARDVLQKAVQHHSCAAYPMEGFWEYMENVGEYYDVQFDILRNRSELLSKWPIITNMEYRGVGFAPGALYHGSARVTDSSVSAGCRIGGIVEHSILSPGVVVCPGAVVRNSILMHDVFVGPNARLEGVVSDKDAQFDAGCSVGEQESHSPIPPEVSSGAGPLTLVGKGAFVGRSVIVAKGEQVGHRTRLPDTNAMDTSVAV